MPKELQTRPVRRAPATNPEDREKQLVAMAVNLAEKQLANGTASSQVITHYLRLGTTREKIEKEILEKQKELITAKTEALKSNQDLNTLYAEAIDAMRRYSGDMGGDSDTNV